MKIAMIGNVAQNAYLNAKFLRRLGIEADSFDLGGGPPASTPQWEDGYFDEQLVGGAFAGFYHWTGVPMENGFQRPAWAKILGYDGENPWYDTEREYEADLPRIVTRLSAQFRVREDEVPALRLALARGRVSPQEQQVHLAHARGMPLREAILAIAEAYDLTVLYGPAAQYGIFFPKDLPYVTYEHATMRYIHLFGSPADAVLASAYQHADWNLLTNADCHEAAQCLGLTQYSWVPHPLDEDKFSPGETPHRAQLLEAHGAELLFYAPARHSASESSGSKRNERILYAFQRYVETVERTGGPRALLILAEWGEHVKQSAELAQRLGLMDEDPETTHIVWTRCIPKMKMLHLYRAADVVLDQFSPTVGSFGTVTAEGLACGKPVITHINPDVHAWCLPTLPPVANALTTDEVYRQMVLLATSEAYRQQLGAASRKWVEDYHGWRYVAGLHLELYRELLGRSLPTEAANQAAAQAKVTRARLWGGPEPDGS